MSKDRQETVRKLAGIWENPSVRQFSSEISDGEFKVIVGSDEVYGLIGSKKIASLKTSELDADVRADGLIEYVYADDRDDHPDVEASTRNMNELLTLLPAWD